MGRIRDRHGAGAFRSTSPFSLGFPADPLSVRGALQAVKGVLREMKIATETMGLVEIVLAEVLNNVVEHAYAEAAPGPVELTMEQHGTALAFVIRDWGQPMPGGTAPAGRRHDLDVKPDQLPEGGFGWHLIRALTTDLCYTRDGSRNTLHFRVPLDPPAPRH